MQIGFGGRSQRYSDKRACACAQSCLTLCDPVGFVAHKAPLCMGFSR